MRHSESNSLLQLSKQETCFDSGRGGKWRGSHLAMQPNQRFVFGAHAQRVYVQTDITTTRKPTARANLELKLKAVTLSQLKGVEVQAADWSPTIHSGKTSTAG